MSAASRARSGRGEDGVAKRFEGGLVPVHHPSHPGRAPLVWTAGGHRVKIRDFRGEICHALERKSALGGEAVAEVGLVEPVHVHEPLDRPSDAVERECAVGLARDGHHPTVDLGRRSAVEDHLGVAEAPTSVGRGEVEVVVPHRSLHLQRPGAGQEDNGAVRLDAVDARAGRPVGVRLGQKRHHLGLILGDHAGQVSCK